MECSHNTYPRSIGSKNKYMKIGYLVWYISTHLFLCWIRPSPINRYVFEGIATHSGHSLSWPPQQHAWVHSCTASLSPNSSSGDPWWPVKWGEFLSSPFPPDSTISPSDFCPLRTTQPHSCSPTYMPAATATPSQWCTVPTSLTECNHTTYVPCGSTSDQQRPSGQFLTPSPLIFPESSS